MKSNFYFLHLEKVMRKEILVNWKLKVNISGSPPFLSQDTQSPKLYTFQSDWLSCWPSAQRASVYKNLPFSETQRQTANRAWEDSQRTNRKQQFSSKCCNWKHQKMCKGLAALPQTCLERWELHHSPVFNSVESDVNTLISLFGFGSWKVSREVYSGSVFFPSLLNSLSQTLFYQCYDSLEFFCLLFYLQIKSSFLKWQKLSIKYVSSETTQKVLVKNAF